jgi:pimeloyl-ACP methyl ester carboxylesterase
MTRSESRATANREASLLVRSKVVRAAFIHYSSVLLVAILLTAGAAVVVSRAQHEIAREPYWRSRTVDWPPSSGTAGYALTPLATAPGVVLQGAVHPAQQTPPHFILFFPGSSPDQLKGSVPLLEKLRAGLPLGAAVWSYRSAGASTGTPSPEAATVDARAQVAYLKRRYGVTPEQLLVVGYSFGSGSALKLAADLSRANTPPAALLLMSPFRELRLHDPEWYGQLVRDDLYSNKDLADAVRCPVLIVAGDRDEALPIDLHARPLARSFGARARYLELPGKGHVDYLADATSLQPLNTFLKTNMSSSD